MNIRMSMPYRPTAYIWVFLLMSAAACWFSIGLAAADSFEDSPPVWEPLLWGGKLFLESEGNQPDSQSLPGLSEGDRSRTTARPDVDQSSSSKEASVLSEAPRGMPSLGASDIIASCAPVFVGLKDKIVAKSAEPNMAAVGYCRTPYKSVWLKNIPPLYRSPELPGEGIWQSQGMPTGPDGQPVMYRTSYRPSVQYANAIVHMLLFDMKAVSMNLFVGSGEPGGSERTATVPRDDRPNLIAVTNALWKQKHSGEGGTIFRGHVIKKLTPGLATIVSYKDGSVDIVEWNDGIPLSLINDAKQLRHLILKDGKVVDHIIKGGKREDSEIGLGYLLSENEADPGGYGYWYGYGGFQPQANYGPEWFIATRSAFGIRGDGNLVFAAGYHISTKDLAKALALAGCERAIHGDANPHNVLGNIYHIGGDGLILKKGRLSPEQKPHTVDRYVDRSYTSDFFGFFISRDDEKDSS